MNTLDKNVEEIESMKNDAYETLKEERKTTWRKQNSGELRELSFWIDLCNRCCGEVCG